MSLFKKDRRPPMDRGAYAGSEVSPWEADLTKKVTATPPQIKVSKRSGYTNIVIPGVTIRATIYGGQTGGLFSVWLDGKCIAHETFQVENRIIDGLNQVIKQHIKAGGNTDDITILESEVHNEKG